MAKTKTKPKSTTQKLIDRYGRQAVAEAFLRFNPERSGLRQSLADVAAQEKQGISSARSVFNSVRGATAQARPQLDKIFGDQATLSKALQDAAPASITGPAAGAAAIEQSLAQRRLGEQKTSALADTIARDGEAASGMAFQVGNVRARAAQDREKVRNRLAELDRETGAFVQGRVGSLAEARAKRAAEIRKTRLQQQGQDRRQEDQQDFTAGEKAKDRAAADRRAREKRQKKAEDKRNSKLPRASEGQVKDFKTAVGYSQAKDEQGRPLVPDDVRNHSGRLRVYLEAHNTGGTSPYLLRAAAEAAADGFIHKKTAAMIRKHLGIRVRDLGYPVR